MRPKFFFTLRVKLALFTILLISAVGFVVMSATAGLMRNTLSSEIKEKGIAVARSIAHSSEDALVGSGDELYLFQFINAAKDDRGVAYVQIVDDKGTVRAHSDTQKSLTKYEPLQGVTQVEHGEDYTISEAPGLKGDRVFDITVPIRLTGSGKFLGEVHLGLSSAVIEEATDRVRRTVGWVALGGLLLGGFGAFGMAKLATGPIKLLVNGVNEVGRGNLDQEIKIKSKDEIGELTEAFNNMTRGLREKEHIKDTFQRYMSKQLADSLFADPERIKLELGGEHRPVSVLFTDIRGFTRMSEGMDPKGVISFLNEYFSMMVEIVFEHGGFIDKFIGDAMMIIYGVPVKAEDDAVRCVKTALAMRGAMASYNAARAAKGLPAVHIGIGINSGTAVAGNVGSKERMNYTVIGDVVNVAARLVTQSREENIIISQDTYDLVKDRFVIEKREQAALKGKHDLQQLYEVMGEK